MFNADSTQAASDGLIACDSHPGYAMPHVHAEWPIELHANIDRSTTTEDPVGYRDELDARRQATIPLPMTPWKPGNSSIHAQKGKTSAWPHHACCAAQGMSLESARLQKNSGPWPIRYPLHSNLHEARRRAAEKFEHPDEPDR